MAIKKPSKLVLRRKVRDRPGTMEDLAKEEFGASEATLRRWCRDDGIPYQMGGQRNREDLRPPKSKLKELVATRPGTMEELARELDVTRGTVRKWCRESGITPDEVTHRKTRPKSTELKELVETRPGTMEELAAELGVSYAALWRWCKAAGVPNQINKQRGHRKRSSEE